MLGFGKTHKADGFPPEFRLQQIGVRGAMEAVDLAPADVAAYFQSHKETAQALLSESYDKRYSPSTFIQEEVDGYSVGWYSNGYECVQSHSNLADAAADYLLFSRGKGRWRVSENTTHPTHL
jgi:hypothetical protein